jgi:hypothetical protein
MTSIKAFFAGRRLLFVVWMLSCAVAIFATARLSVFMFDPAQTSFSMVPDHDLIRRHSCVSAYVAGAALLGEPGARIYDPSNYPRHADDAVRRIPIGQLEQDKFEYPPTFLLLPKGLLLVSRSFQVLRALWFVLTTIVLLGTLGAVAAWIGGRIGLVTALLIPLCWMAPSNLVTLQLGNIQLVVCALTFLAMVAFDRGRPAVGGATLAFAIGAKLYPGIFLLVLLVQRRWREVLWTAGWALLYCAGILTIAGLSPFHEFLTFQLPRLVSGEAFSSMLEDATSRATNVSIFGLPYHLQRMGLMSNADRIAPVLRSLYGAGLVALVLLVARSGPAAIPAAGSESRAARAMLWVALLNLSVMQAPFLPPYGLLGTTWLLAIWAPQAQSFARAAALLVPSWLVLTVVVPTPEWLFVAMNTLAILVNLGLNLVALLWALRRRPEQEDRSAPGHDAAAMPASSTA